MSELNQPHDRFFGKVFSQMDTVEDILINNVPLIADILVKGTLEDCREKFVDSDLERYYSDLYLKGQLKDGGEAYFFILIEHKSFHKRLVAFDLNEYMMQMWKKVKEAGKPLPFIFPIVIYHGKNRWTTDTNFASLVHIPKGMKDYVPHFNYFLLDLSQYSDEDIKGAILSRVILLLFKYIYHDSFGREFIRICNLLGELGDEKTSLEYMGSIIEYIGNATDKITEEEVKEGITKALPQKGEKLMPTLFERIEERGRVEGRVEGLRLPLELKYGQEGLDFYQRIEEIAALDTIHKIEKAIREGASLDELEKLLNDN